LLLLHVFVVPGPPDTSAHQHHRTSTTRPSIKQVRFPRHVPPALLTVADGQILYAVRMMRKSSPTSTPKGRNQLFTAT
jgi:hypothetical protein